MLTRLCPYPQCCEMPFATERAYTEHRRSTHRKERFMDAHLSFHDDSGALCRSGIHVLDSTGQCCLKCMELEQDEAVAAERELNGFKPEAR